MKKLSLKNATSMLSRKEMKAIYGGYDGSGSGTYCATVYNYHCEQHSFCSDSEELTQSWVYAWVGLGWTTTKWCHLT